MNTIFLKRIITGIILFLSLMLSAQNPAELDTSFDIGTGFDAEINVITLQPDGKILVGGYFSSYNGQPHNRLIRLNADGSIDTSFDIGIGFIGYPYPPLEGNGYVRAITVQSDGKILVGGYFYSFNGQPYNGVIRLNADGSPDTSFSSGTGTTGSAPNGYVTEFAIQPDGKIIIVGVFSGYNGQSRNNIARLNTDGSLDTPFVVTFDSSLPPPSWTTKIQPDGKILIGGFFFPMIKRVNTDGSTDTSFDIGTGFGPPNIGGTVVRSLVLLPDGKILTGGKFTSYNGQTVNNIARLNTDGSLDTSFVTGFDDDGIFKIELQSDGKIIVSGWFTSYNGQSYNRLARLNANGSIDTSFDIGTGFNDYIRAVALQPNGKILVGGRFISYNGQTANRLVRLYGGGSASVENMNSTAIKIYPNPAQNFINLSGSEIIRTIIISDMSGRTVLKREYNNEEVNVDISDLSKAVYLLTFHTDKGKETVKIVKK